MTSETLRLADRKCRPCNGETPPLSAQEIQVYLKKVSGWELSHDGNEIIKNYTLKNFQFALDLTSKIGALAESEDHHPNLYIHRYKRLRIELSTHAIGGLSENDFILAAKIDKLKN